MPLVTGLLAPWVFWADVQWESWNGLQFKWDYFALLPKSLGESFSRISLSITSFLNCHHFLIIFLYKILESQYDNCFVRTLLFDFFSDDYSYLREELKDVDIGLAVNSVGVGREFLERYGDNPDADHQLLRVNGLGAAEVILIWDDVLKIDC